MASSYSAEIDDIEMSCKGMQLLLNNDIDACEALFERYRFYSPLMNGAWSFVSFMVRNSVLHVSHGRIDTWTDPLYLSLSF